MSNAEILLWSRLRKKQIKGHQFYRQRIIGNFIVDFYCPKGKLIVELDGGQHYNEEENRKDRIRDDYMKKLGMKILRVSDREVFENVQGVLEKIYEIL